MEPGLRVSGWTSVSCHTVLLLEDEPLIRSATAEVLIDAGHVVIEAANATAALALLRDDPEIDVLVADINLAGSINGCEAANRALQIRPTLRVIITSGAEPDGVPPQCHFLPKPYRLHQIVNAVAGSRLVRSRS